MLGRQGTASGAVALGMQVPFDASFAGTLNASSLRDRTTITIDATLSRDAGVNVPLHIVLEGEAFDSGGVEMQRSTVMLGTSTQTGLYQGSVVALNGTDLRTHLRDAAGTSITLAMHLNLDSSSTAVTGTASVQAGAA